MLGILAKILGIIGTAVGIGATVKNIQAQQDALAQNQQFNSEQRAREDNQIQRKIADGRQAGLNPLASMGISTSQYNVSNPSQTMLGAQANVNQSIQSMLGQFQNFQSTEQNQQSLDLTERMADITKDFNNRTLANDFNKWTAQLKWSKTDAERTRIFNAAMKQMDIKLSRDNLDKTLKSNEKIAEENNNTQKSIAVTNALSHSFFGIPFLYSKILEDNVNNPETFQMLRGIANDCVKGISKINNILNPFSWNLDSQPKMETEPDGSVSVRVGNSKVVMPKDAVDEVNANTRRKQIENGTYTSPSSAIGNPMYAPSMSSFTTSRKHGGRK